MKKISYILMILILLTALAGCGQAQAEGLGETAGAKAAGSKAAKTEAADAGGSETASIYICMEGEPGEDYAAATVQVAEGQAGVQQEARADQKAAEIKLRGNSSKESEKKAYTVKFEDELELLGMEAGKKWALVSNPFDKSLLRPAIGFAYAEALGLDYVSETRLCQVWLNDEYMGVYTAMEPVEAGEGRVEIDVESGDFLLERNIGRLEEDVVYIDSPAGLRFEFNEPEEPDAAQQEQCRQMLGQAEEAVFSGDHTQYEKLIDVESFINFYIFHEMVKDVDFGEYSTRYYFKDGIMYAGPPWDLDLTMGNASAEKDEHKYASYNEAGDSSQGLWANAGDYYYWLCRDPWFMEKVQQRWQAVRHVTENLAVDNELGRSLIDGYLEEHLGALEGNFDKWCVSEPAHVSEWQKPGATYMENVEMLRLWLIKRAAYLDSQWGPYVYDPALAVI